MKKALFIFHVLLIISFASTSQPGFDWVTKFNISDDFGRSITLNDSNDIYFAGYSGYTSIGQAGIIIAKTDSTSLQWKYSAKIVTPGHSEVYKIRTDALGYIYILFELNGSLAFGMDTITSTFNGNMYLAKLTDSVLVWYKEMPFDSHSELNLLETTPDGNSYVMATFLNTQYFGPDTFTCNGQNDIYISKISDTGQFIWTQVYSVNSSNTFRKDAVQGLSLDTAEHIYAFYSQAFETSNGEGISYIVKLDSSGQLLKQEQITGFDGKITEISAYTTSSSGNSYILLETGSNPTIIKDTTIDMKYRGHVLVIYDDTLRFIKKAIVLDTILSSFFHPRLIEVDHENKIAIGGRSVLYTFSFAIDSIYPGFFMLSYDSLLNFNWMKNFATDQSSSEGGFSEMSIKNNHIYFICHAEEGSSNFVTFDSLSFSTFDNDIFLGKVKNELLNCYNLTGTLVLNSCNNYHSPSGNHIWTASGTYMDTVQNSRGCDSVISVFLTIDTLNATIINTSPTLTANISNAIYQWLDCNNNYSEIIGETNLSYTPTTNGNYAVEIIDNACIDTSACESVINVSIARNNLVNTVEVSPNPTYGKLSIDLGHKYAHISVIVRNSTGQITHNSEYRSVSFVDIIIEGEPGFYFLEIRADDKVATLKITKQ